jgi:hypothetical protein
LETRATAFLISPVIVTGFEQKHPKRAHSSHLPSWKDCFLRDRAKNKQKRFGRNKMRFGWKTTFAAMAVAFAIAPGAANAVDYKGKKITFIVPFKEGGGGSVYTRFLSPLFAKHLPGAPTAVVRNIPGGGSVKGANEFMRKAKPDGRVVFNTGTGTLYKYLLKQKSVKYDPRDFIPLMASPFGVLIYVRSELGVKTGEVKKLLGRQIIMGDRSPTAGGMPILLSYHLLGLDVKYIFGLSTGKRRQAFQRGETTINQDNNAAYTKKVLPLIKEGVAVPLYSLGYVGKNGEIVRDPMLPNIPTFNEIYEQIHGKKLSGVEARVWKAVHTIKIMAAKMMVLPKGTNKDVIAAYHAAAQKVVNDSEVTGKNGKKLLGPYPQALGKDAMNVLLASSVLDKEAQDWLINWTNSLKK